MIWYNKVYGLSHSLSPIRDKFHNEQLNIYTNRLDVLVGYVPSN